VKANNTGGSTTALPISIGSSAVLKDSVVAKGNITIKAGTVKQVFLPTTATYSGPTPTLPPVNKVAIASLKLPVFPSMPTTIPIDHVGTTNITSTATIVPGYYGNLALAGGQTITLSGTGTYVFNSIKNSGSSNNTFVFDFQNVTGNFIILVKGD